ncbi:MAG: plasma-membrane proton-efflux P-type ATPase [Gammaproteobacteria bacterium]
MDRVVSDTEGQPSSNPTEVFDRLGSGPQGLSSTQVAERLARTGYNVLEEHRVSPLVKFLGYFWGPIPWMIEVAAILSATLQHWADLVIILVLLVFNAAVGFYQEYNAGNAIEQLRKSLALRARARRDDKWQEVPARELVPGDVVRLRLGDIIPADIVLFDGDYLSVDQSALTGESLPVQREVGETVYSGSAVKQGEMLGVVTATGANTYFGKTAKLVDTAKTVSHFQHAVLTIGDYLIYITLGLIGLLVVVMLYRQQPLLELVQFALILTVAAIPVAMPAVLSVTMAVGAVVLSHMKAIVARLESIEEMAGMDILCSDKTGTLTKNALTLGDPVSEKGLAAQDLVLAAALASRTDGGDAIDQAVVNGLSEPSRLQAFALDHFTPFDPVQKRSEARVHDSAHGERFSVTKGAPQVILDLSAPDAAARERIESQVDDFAERGYRTLGVARSDDGEHWSFLGLLPLYDPPRDDAAQTIEQAEAHGVKVKMITGDNRAIARETATHLNLGHNILPAGALKTGEQAEPRDIARDVEVADGFAEVFPEHKFSIVQALQSRNHLVGMTGDGVNDAPALKQADVGIAVSGATDAARAAADLVLTAPGLSVIVSAVEEARRIFERMNSYAIYRITETIRIMIFIVLAMLVYDFYPITAIMIILLALLNDLPIMTIAADNTWLDPRPVRWNMRRVLTIATVLGGVGVIETFGLLVIAESWLKVGHAQLQSIIFLKLVVAGHLTLFVARTRRPFFTRPYPAAKLLTAVVSTQVLAAMIVGFGWFVPAIPWRYVGFVWAYALVWMLIEDAAKLMVYRHLDFGARRHHRFLSFVRRSLFEHEQDNQH